MNPNNFQTSIISHSQMTSIRGGNDEPIVVATPIVALPPREEEKK